MLSAYTSFTVTDAFLQPYLDGLLERGIEHQWKMCEETGRIENFRRVARGEQGTFEGSVYNDSDVHKLAEATFYAYSLKSSDKLRSRLETYTHLIEGAIQPDGYLNTYICLNFPDQRYFSLASRHELYCMGHFLEAACAAKESGLSMLADPATRLVEHLLETFGEGKRKGYCGHQELELALARYAKTFNDPRALELSRWMTDSRGTRPSPFEEEFRDPAKMAVSRGYENLAFKDGTYVGDYFQDGRPLREEVDAVGHSVRAMYQYCGALDGYGSTDGKLNQALQTIWQNLISKRMYVTGGIGSSGENEGFTFDYDLPNRTAYAETCASIGLCMWAARMGLVFGESHYYDVFERCLLNGVLSGMNMDGDRYFYENPLESRGDRERKPWYTCACCPPNIARFLLSLGRYVWSFDDTSLSLHMMLSGKGQATIQGSELGIDIQGSHLMGEDQKIMIESNQAVEFTLRVRIPDWARSAEFMLDGESVEGEMLQGDWCLKRVWPAGKSELAVALTCKPRLVECDPRVLENLGRVCIMQGPVVMCLEGKEFAAQEFILNRQEPIGTHVSGWIEKRGSGSLYREQEPGEMVAVSAELIPYAQWGNSGIKTMQVWHRIR